VTLPDAAKRKIIARNLGISANNDFAMLEEMMMSLTKVSYVMGPSGKLTQQKSSEVQEAVLETTTDGTIRKVSAARVA
jgi:hypothetical protein